ncbi:MAG TPA: alpha/beta hydrolase [Intrasporangium sp.]|uniref:alpha/beta hydrolase family protein n=1 Tax=Intrasporangium sp. TaxID=1925024 RepID=UPI002D76D150|nr:alpha/beta hydrolase [Intrasporangium sp.]HET7398013.1 alpha/beta hydrolase [Intrasporangium sp.]
MTGTTPARLPGGAESTRVGRTTAYGEDPAQVYDVVLPAAPLGATVLVVHGGFWRAVTDRAHARPQARALADAGFTVALGEYRRAGMPGGGVPGTLDDVAALVAAVRADAALPDPVILVGHSAGGHLVTWAANQPWADGLAGVVALAGCVDLAAAERMHLGADAARAFLGGAPSEAPQAWAAADPMRGLPPRVPVRLVHGRQDDVVPLAVTDDYVARCVALGADVTLAALDRCDHFGVIDPAHPAFAAVVATCQALLPPSLPDRHPG